MRRNRLIAVSALATVLVAMTPVGAAQAATWYQYALNRQLSDYTTVSSATATVSGGKGQFATTVPAGMRVVVQTYSGSTLVYQSSGASVTFTHGPVSSSRSRCYWYYSFGPVADPLPLNCWRYQ